MRPARPPKDVPPPLELECLKALWQIGEANVSAVHQLLLADRKLAYTTVMTLLERLSRKGSVSRRKTGRFFVYKALVDQDTMRQRAVRDLTDALFGGSRKELLAYLQGDGARPARVGVPAVEKDREERLDASLL